MHYNNIEEMKLIDAHVHIFPPEIIEKRDQITEKDPGFGALYKDRRSRMATLDDLLAYMRRCAIDGCVVCGFPFRDKGLLALQNDYLIQAQQVHISLWPLVAINVADEETALSEIERCLKKGAAGAGEIAIYDSGLGRRELESLDSLARILESRNATLMLHVNEQVGHPYKGKSAIDLPEIVRFVQRHHDLKIILAHLGGGLCFYEFMPEIKKSFAKVFYDTAASPFLYSDEVYRFIEEFLHDKTIFGSDFPLLSFPKYESNLMSFREEKREMLFYSNARRAFGRA
jgi:uncharacterized protein